MFELNSRTVCALAPQCQQALFSLLLCLFMVLYTPSSPQPPQPSPPFHSLSLGSSPHWEHFFFFCISSSLFPFASGGVNKGLKNCSKNFHISVFMLRGKAKCTSPMGRGEAEETRGGRQRCYNRKDIGGQMCEDILFFCYIGSFVVFPNVPGSFIDTASAKSHTYVFW